jgi:uncharacterized protein (DUF58 family)
VTIRFFHGGHVPLSDDSDNGFNLFGTLKRIEIATRKPIKGAIQGMNRSLIRQTGIEFADIREYIPGDDLRSIDWKVTARMNRPFLRECTEDRDQTFYFVIDRSGSCAFGSEFPKERRILEIAASLIYAAYRNGERTSLCCYTDDIEWFFPPGRGKTHLISSLRLLSTHNPKKTATNLDPVIRFLCNSVKRRSAVIIISDFLCPIDARSVSILCRKHEVTAVQITDRNENVLPDIGMIMMEDEESGEQVLVDTKDPYLRSAFSEKCAEYDRFVSSTFANAGAGFVRIDTGDDYAAILNRYFSGFSRRM